VGENLTSPIDPLWHLGDAECRERERGCANTRSRGSDPSGIRIRHDEVIHGCVRHKFGGSRGATTDQ
jgi:hypothetical protein